MSKEQDSLGKVFRVAIDTYILLRYPSPMLCAMLCPLWLCWSCPIHAHEIIPLIPQRGAPQSQSATQICFRLLPT
jgi:hypothetical protein